MLKIRKQKHQCPGCLKFFRHRINLSSHVCTVESLVCKECNATFSKESVLLKHTIKYHSTQLDQKQTTLENERKDVAHEEVSNARASSVIGQNSVSDESILNCLPPEDNNNPGQIQCRKCSIFVRRPHRHALCHITGARRFKCSLAGCHYSAWSRQAIESHMKTRNHPHATIIDNQNPRLNLEVTQMMEECFAESIKQREHVKTKPALIPCNKCSVPVSDLPAYRKQHAKVHITDVGPFGCSVSGCEYSTWWRRRMRLHTQQHQHAAILEHQSAELQMRLTDMVIECFGTPDRQILTSSDPTVRAPAGTEQIPMETNATDVVCAECSSQMPNDYGGCWLHCELHLITQPYMCSACGVVNGDFNEANKHKNTHWNALVIDRLNKYDANQYMHKLFGDNATFVCHSVLDDCRSPEVRDEVVVRKNQKPKKKAKTGRSVSSKPLVSRCASSDANTRPIDNHIEMTNANEYESSFATGHRALVEGETAYETCERIHRKMDALQQRLKRLKNLAGKK